MSSIYLIDSQGNTYSSYKITLESQNNIRSSKKVSQGRWYYEVKHIDGYGFISVSFMLNNDEETFFGFYQYGDNKNNIIYFQNVAVYSTQNNKNIKPYTEIGISESTEGSTIGVSFDTYTKIFSVFIGNEQRHFNISASKINVVEPLLRELTSGGTEKYSDNIIVNFGPNFEYDIPYGYLPWCKALPRNSCNNKRRVLHSLNFFCFFAMCQSCE